MLDGSAMFTPTAALSMRLSSPVSTFPGPISMKTPAPLSCIRRTQSSPQQPPDHLLCQEPLYLFFRRRVSLSRYVCHDREPRLAGDYAV